jgi:MFS family permease
MCYTRASAFFVVAVVAGPGAGRLGDRIAHSTVATAALIASILGLTVMVVAPTIPSIAAGITAFAVGTRSFPPVMQAYLLSSFPDDSMGADFGALKTIYTGVGSLGPAYVGLVAQQFNYVVAFAGLVPFLVLAGGILLRLSNSS